MKKILFLLLLVFGFTACEKTDFADSYTDPSKIAVSTVEKQFTGFLNSNKWYVLPDYTNYFVVLRMSLNRYNQTVGWENTDNQYVTGGGLIQDRWNNFYGFVAQYREIEKIYNALPKSDQDLRRIYKIASTIYFYDHVQKVVDLHGDAPILGAGMLSTNSGDYVNSLPKYDTADGLYTKMLNDLKALADELSTINVNAGILAGFKTQDFVNKGDLASWTRYCNSLRLRMLTRVSGVSAFSARAKSEIAEIVANPTKYPVITTNAQNIQINVYDISTDIHAKNFRTGLEDWNGNLSGKVMIDHMNKNADPRLRAIFEAGLNAKGAYIGLDQSLNASAQAALVAGGTIAIYNRSTLSRNQFCPGILMNAAEVSLLLAEYQLNAGNDAAAKMAYENAIKLSTEMYYNIRKVSNDNTAIALTPYTDAEVTKYTTATDINWANAKTSADKLGLIAMQKWLHFNVMQSYENWAEVRRLDMPKLTFPNDPSNKQTQPPVRWTYPSSEIIYNTENYSAVKSKDDLNTKIFWDIK